MIRRCAEAAISAKKQTDKLIGKDRYPDRYFQPVIDELARLFPKKLAPTLALHSGKSQRVCELWLEGKTQPGGDALAALICSPIGDTVLLALTRRCDQPWLANIRTTNEIAKLRRQQKEASERLAALEAGIR